MTQKMDLTIEKVHCNYCGKEGEVQTVSVPSHECIDNSETMCINTNGWFIGIGIDYGYDPGDAEVEIDKKDNFCSWTCLDSRRVQREAQRAERAEAEKKRNHITSILNRRVRERGLVALKAEHGEDLYKAVEEGRLK